MAEYNNSIMVLGAGELGMAILHALKSHPRSAHIPISILLRPSTPSTPASDSKARQLAALSALGIPIIPGDLMHDDIPTLVSLFKPFGTIISCTGFVTGSGTQLKLAAAVLEAGVKRYFPWQWGVDYDVIGRGSGQDLFDEQIQVRELLRGQSGTEWTVVSTGMFMSFLFEDAWGVVQTKKGGERDGEGEKTKVTALGGWDNAVTVTAVEDIGRITAEIVFQDDAENSEVRRGEGEGGVGRVLYTASETISYFRLVEVVEKVFGEEVERAAWPVEYLEEELAKDPGDSLKKYRVVFARGKGVSWDFERTFNAQNGIPVVGVEEWARENLKK